MSATVTKPLLRWSSVRSCPRKAVYEWEGAPARDRTAQEEGWLWRGKSVGRDYTLFLASQTGKKVWVESGHDYWVPPDLRAADRESAGLIAETKIEWPVGVGHADIYIPETRTVVEILSSAAPGEEMTRSKLLQCVGYVEHHPQAENGALVILNPSDFTSERIVLVQSSRQYQELRADMLSRIAELQRWQENGEMPVRVCSQPSEARAHFCQHAAHCFADAPPWTPPEPDAWPADEALVAAVETFEQAKRARKEIGANEKAWKQRQDEAQAVIEAAELPVKTPVAVGPFVVTRTTVSRKPTLDWERAEMAGALEPGMLGEFFRPGASYSTYKAERQDVSGDEYGDEVPF